MACGGKRTNTVSLAVEAITRFRSAENDPLERAGAANDAYGQAKRADEDSPLGGEMSRQFLVQHLVLLTAGALDELDRVSGEGAGAKWLQQRILEIQDDMRKASPPEAE